MLLSYYKVGFRLMCEKDSSTIIKVALVVESRQLAVFKDFQPISIDELYSRTVMSNANHE